MCLHIYKFNIDKWGYYVDSAIQVMLCREYAAKNLCRCSIWQINVCSPALLEYYYLVSCLRYRKSHRRSQGSILREKEDLNRTQRDWRSDAHADRSRVVRLLHRSARSACAETYARGDFSWRARPYAGRITSCPVWVPIGITSAAPLRCRPDAERSGPRPFLFTL